MAIRKIEMGTEVVPGAILFAPIEAVPDTQPVPSRSLFCGDLYMMFLTSLTTVEAVINSYLNGSDFSRSLLHRSEELLELGGLTSQMLSACGNPDMKWQIVLQRRSIS